MRSAFAPAQGNATCRCHDTRAHAACARQGRRPARRVRARARRRAGRPHLAKRACAAGAHVTHGWGAPAAAACSTTHAPVARSRRLYSPPALSTKQRASANASPHASAAARFSRSLRLIATRAGCAGCLGARPPERQRARVVSWRRTGRFAAALAHRATPLRAASGRRSAALCCEAWPSALRSRWSAVGRRQAGAMPGDAAPRRRTRTSNALLEPPFQLATEARQRRGGAMRAIHAARRYF